MDDFAVFQADADPRGRWRGSAGRTTGLVASARTPWPWGAPSGRTVYYRDEAQATLAVPLVSVDLPDGPLTWNCSRGGIAGRRAAGEARERGRPTAAF